MTQALHPVPSALAGGHQGLPVGLSAPSTPERRVIRASTGTDAPADAPARPRPAPAATAAAATAGMPGCDAAGDAGKPSLSLPWITFEFGSAQLAPESIKVLQTLGKTLNDSYADGKFMIEGHTDVAGTYDYNHELSLQRAQAVKDYLIQQAGVKAQLDVAGVGYCDLANPSSPRAAENRRVVVINRSS
jgi:outer membrane protein OmpA-like peptidoglycan-associated protein